MASTTTPTTDINKLLDQILSSGGKPDQQTMISLLVAGLLQGQQGSQQLLDMMSAPRTDAYGNSVSYDPATGWKIKTDPTSKAIIDQGQSEQLRSLQQDAPRNRAAAERADLTARNASDAFSKAVSEYRYAPQKSEADFIGDDQKHNAWAAQDNKSSAAALTAQAALRSGQPQDFEKVFNAANSQGDTSDVLGRGIRTGRQNALTYGSEGPKQKEAAFLAGLSQTNPTAISANPNALAGQVDQLNNQFMSGFGGALQSGTTQMTAALQQLFAALKSGVKAGA